MLVAAKTLALIVFVSSCGSRGKKIKRRVGAECRLARVRKNQGGADDR